MNKNLILVAIGILALVIALMNYMIMNPIAQQHHETFKAMLNQFGYQGNPENYGSIEETIKNGLQFSYEWKRVYDAYQTTLTEIYLVSAICVAIALICFYYAGYKYLRSLRKYKQAKLQTR